MKKFSVLLILFSILNMLSASAQVNEVFSESIASLTVVADYDWQALPVTRLGGRIDIDFDELSHEYHRYTYRIEHCEADWSLTEGLFESDYLQGFTDGNVIEDAEESVGTYQLYTHYHLSLPNRQCSIKMSGNYRVAVFDDNEDDEQPLLYAYFMVTEQTGGINIQMTTNTDVDVNNAHQQIIMQVAYGQLQVNDLQRQLTTVVLQNQRWDEAVVNAPSQYTLRDGLRWEHCRELIFRGGNEYHKFETMDPRNVTLGLANVGWDDQRDEWHAYVEADYQQRSYTYNTDANGCFLIRNSDNYENNTESDYVLTHFQLFVPQQNRPIFVGGLWTGYSSMPAYQMEWDEAEKCYAAVVLLKQGHYSYCYLEQHPDGSLHRLGAEGCFYETENRYDALLYYRGPADRTDRLVGHAVIQKEK